MSEMPLSQHLASALLPAVSFALRLRARVKDGTTGGAETQADVDAAEMFDDHVILTADEGHSEAFAARSLCDTLRQRFYTNASSSARSWSVTCESDVEAAIRHRRALYVTHTAEYARAVAELEAHLVTVKVFPHAYSASQASAPRNTYTSPYRAHALLRLARPVLGDPSVPLPGRTFCQVGFGLGHTAALFLATYSDVAAVCVDTCVREGCIAAHDFLDHKYGVMPPSAGEGVDTPSRLLLTVGDSRYTLPRLPDYLYGLRCAVTYVDAHEHSAAELVAADLRQLHSLAAPQHVVAMACPAGAECRQAWQDMVDAGKLRWHGTFTPHPDERLLAPSTSDAIVYGTFVMHA